MVRSSYLSQAKAGDFIPIDCSMSGFVICSPFALLANITAPDFVRGSAIAKHLNAPLSPQCHIASPRSVR
jgi:hypothetical protein